LTPTQDDGFHEIQLNGKQLVFLFMAATVVSVVIFLCGVFVGRGVRAERTSTVADAGASLPASELTPQPPAVTPAPTPAPAGSDPRAAAPPPAVDDLSYFNRLEKQSPAPEKLKPSAAKPPSAAKLPAAAPPSKTPPAPEPPAAAVSSDAGARQWAVQVAAVNERSAADAIVRRLSSKGYAAYVVAPTDGTSVFRVRVGRFSSQREAEPTKAKLEKEEQFKPWITR
jgi:cell division septation protein DedD